MAGPGSQRNKASEEHAAWPASQGAAWHFLAAAGNDSTCMHVLLPPEHPQPPLVLVPFTPLLPPPLPPVELLPRRVLYTYRTCLPHAASQGWTASWPQRP